MSKLRRRGCCLCWGPNPQLALLWRSAVSLDAAETDRMDRQRVLFLCTNNTARSQMAEAFLKKYGGNRFNVESAGLEPGEKIHPLTNCVMAEAGIDMAGQHPKSLRPFLGRERVDLVVFVCDR